MRPQSRLHLLALLAAALATIAAVNGQPTGPGDGPACNATDPGIASIPPECVRIWPQVPERCLYDPTNPDTFNLNGPNCVESDPEGMFACPAPEEGIPYLHYVNNWNLPLPFPQWFISSNVTQAPFSNPDIDIDDFESPVAQPVAQRVCDNKDRCIEGYVIEASIIQTDLGFTFPNGTTWPVEMLAYNGTVPGPTFVIDQGVQTVIRLYNNIFCDTETNTPLPSSVADAHFYKDITALTMHLHGSTTLSPFDGWTSDFIRPCQWKDYVFPNERGHGPIWYHDHTVGVTLESTGHGLAGTYWLKECDSSEIPAQIAALGRPRYLVFSDQLFIADEGDNVLHPHIKNVTADTLYQRDSGVRLPINTGAGGWIGGDHNLVNGRVWPTVRVQRKPYYFVFHNGAVTRPWNFHLFRGEENIQGENGLMYVVGGDGGLRMSATQADDGLVVGTGERYLVVINFNLFEEGDVITLRNLPSHFSEVPTYCFSHLVMQFRVMGNEARQRSFLPTYAQSEVLTYDTQIEYENVAAACEQAMMTGQADEAFQTTFNLDFENIEGMREQSAAGVFTFDSVSTAVWDSNETWKIMIMGRPGKVDGVGSDRSDGGALSSSSSRRLASSDNVAATHGIPHMSNGAPDGGADAPASGPRVLMRTSRSLRATPVDSEEAKEAQRQRLAALKKDPEHRAFLRDTEKIGELPSGLHIRARKAHRKLAQYPNVTGQTNMRSSRSNAWTTWWIYNPFPAVHPIHIHLTSFYVCGRANIAGFGRNQQLDPFSPFPNNLQGLRPYEYLVPKDVAQLESFSQIAVVMRPGPHQGEYQWHCHNLIHEDEGLMATYNVTNMDAPFMTTGTSWNQDNIDPSRLGGAGMYDRSPTSPVIWYGRDPIVRSVPGTYIGENLGYPDSMPPWAHRTTSDGSPLAMDEAFLRQILQRNYYAAFYPEGRDNLQEGSGGNQWVPICPRKRNGVFY